METRFVDQPRSVIASTTARAIGLLLHVPPSVSPTLVGGPVPPEVCRGGGCRHRRVDGKAPVIRLETGMVRGLENVDAAMIGVPRRHQQTGAGVANAPTTKNPIELGSQIGGVVLRREEMFDGTPAAAEAVGHGPPAWPKIAGPRWTLEARAKSPALGFPIARPMARMPPVEVPANQVEIIAYRSLEILFERSEERRRHRPLDAAAVDRTGCDGRGAQARKVAGVTYYPSGGKSSFPYEFLSRMRPSGRWMTTSLRWFIAMSRAARSASVCVRCTDVTRALPAPRTAQSSP